MNEKEHNPWLAMRGTCPSGYADEYDAAYDTRAAAGQDVHGEATFVERLGVRGVHDDGEAVDPLTVREPREIPFEEVHHGREVAEREQAVGEPDVVGAAVAAVRSAASELSRFVESVYDER